MDQRQIGRRKRIGADLGRCNPSAGRAPDETGLAGLDGTVIKTEPDMMLRVVMFGGEDLFVDRNSQAKLF